MGFTVGFLQKTVLAVNISSDYGWNIDFDSLERMSATIFTVQSSSFLKTTVII